MSWYTSTPVALAQQLADKFQHDTGIKVQLLRTGGQAVLRRLQQEVAAGRPGADVMTMSDAGAANGLAKQGLFVAFRPDGFDKVVSVAKNKDGFWIAQRLSIVGIPIRSDKVAAAGRAQNLVGPQAAEIQRPHGDARPVIHRDPAGGGRNAVAKARLGLLQGAARQ